MPAEQKAAQMEFINKTAKEAMEEISIVNKALAGHQIYVEMSEQWNAEMEQFDLPEPMPETEAKKHA